MSVDIAVVDTAQRCRGVRKAQRQLRRNASPYNSPSMSNICNLLNYNLHNLILNTSMYLTLKYRVYCILITL